MNNMKKRDLELYLHIPFCVKKCNYCDFFSAAGSREEQEAYVQAMIQEIRGYKDSLHSYEVKTVSEEEHHPFCQKGRQKSFFKVCMIVLQFRKMLRSRWK